MKLLTVLFFAITFTTIAYGQLTDLARLEYTYFPQRDSDNSFKRFRVSLNAPVKLSKNGAYLVPGFEYRKVAFDYEDTPNFNIANLDDFDSYLATIGYTFKIKKDLRFAARSGVLIASNFENGGFNSDDLLYSGAVFLVKDRTGAGEAKKPWRLVLGLQYSTRAGRPFPLPIINYYKRFKPNWSYGLGVPKSNVKYFLKKRHIFQSFLTLDGFYANIQNDRQIPTNNNQFETADSISLTLLLAGLGYEFKITDHLYFYAYGGFTLLNDIRLRDEDEEDVFTINDSNSFYTRGGIKFKI